LRDAILAEGADTVSAVIMEPVLSSGGFIIPPLAGCPPCARSATSWTVDDHDEVITGFGRTAAGSASTTRASFPIS